MLYQAVQENIETYLSQAHWEDPLGDAVPAYVEHDLRQYLTCGIFAHGFARAFCDECGHDFLIAFSCKGRGRRWPGRVGAAVTLLCPTDILHGTVDLGGPGPQQAGLPSAQTDARRTFATVLNALGTVRPTGC
jgi:hypothetical protein